MVKESFNGIRPSDLKWGFLVFLLFSSTFLSATPRLKFLEKSHYFGTVKEEMGPVEHKFRFVNIGNEAFTIRAKTSCGCTVANYSRDPVAPGDTGYVEIKFDPKNRPGVFRKGISVIVNESEQQHHLVISGQVRPRPKGPRDYYPFVDGHLRFKTNHFTFGRTKDDQVKTMKTILYNDGDRLLQFAPDKSDIPDWIDLRMSKTALEPGDTLEMVAVYDAAARAEYGFVFDQIYLQSSDDQRPLKTIRFSANIREHFTGSELSRPPRMTLSSTKIDFGKADNSGLTAQVMEVKNTGSSDLIIRRIYSQCTCLDFQMARDTIPPGESESLLVKFNTRGRLGKEIKEFKIIANTPKLPERTIVAQIEIVSEEKSQ